MRRRTCPSLTNTSAVVARQRIHLDGGGHEVCDQLAGLVGVDAGRGREGHKASPGRTPLLRATPHVVRLLRGPAFPLVNWSG